MYLVSLVQLLGAVYRKVKSIHRLFALPPRVTIGRTFNISHTLPPLTSIISCGCVHSSGHPLPGVITVQLLRSLFSNDVAVATSGTVATAADVHLRNTGLESCAAASNLGQVCSHYIALVSHLCESVPGYRQWWIFA